MFYSGGNTDDCKFAIEYIHAKYNHNPIYSYTFSIGANIIINVTLSHLFMFIRLVIFIYSIYSIWLRIMITLLLKPMWAYVIFMISFLLIRKSNKACLDIIIGILYFTSSYLFFLLVCVCFWYFAIFFTLCFALLLFIDYFIGKLAMIYLLCIKKCSIN